MKLCQSLDVDPFPVVEAVFYKFLVESQSIKSPSAATSCTESMNLASAIIGLYGATEASTGPIVMGLCHRMMLKKRNRKQAKVLTRIQVIKLERLLVDPSADRQDPMVRR